MKERGVEKATGWMHEMGMEGVALSCRGVVDVRSEGGEEMEAEADGRGSNFCGISGVGIEREVSVFTRTGQSLAGTGRDFGGGGCPPRGVVSRGG